MLVRVLVGVVFACVVCASFVICCLHLGFIVGVNSVVIDVSCVFYDCSLCV